MNLDRFYKFISDRRFLLLTLACIFCSFFEIFTEWKSVFENPEQCLFLIAIIIVISLFSVYFFKNIKLDEKAVIFLIYPVDGMLTNDGTSVFGCQGSNRRSY